MRLTVVALALLAAPASAQPADSLSVGEPAVQGATDVQWAVMFAGGVSGGGLAYAALEPLITGDVQILHALGAVSVGTALGSHLAARLVGVDGPFLATLAKATAGTLAGFGGAALILTAASPIADAILGEPSCDLLCARYFVALGVGVGLVIVTPAVFAAYRSDAVEIMPAVLAAPTGEAGAGLSLRIGL